MMRWMLLTLIAGGLHWFHDEARAREEARRTGRPLLIDVSARWCAACTMQDRHTWPDADVKREIAARFVPLKLDVTDLTEAQERRMRELEVSALPAIVLLKTGGTLEGAERLEGYSSPSDLLKKLRQFDAR